MGAVEISDPHQDVGRAVDYHQKHLAGSEQVNVDRALLEKIAALEEGRVTEAVAAGTPYQNVSRRKYYQSEGRTLGWIGQLSDHYGLLGKPVDEKTFETLLRGQDPQGIQHIRKYADSDPFSDSAWSGRLQYALNGALKRKRLSTEPAAILRDIPAGAKRPVRAPAEVRNNEVDFAAVRNAPVNPDHAAPRRKPQYKPKPGEFDANAIDIRDLWRDLGGGRLTKDGRGRAFWRDGKDFNVSVGKKGNNFKDFVSGEGGGTIHLAALAWGVSDSDAAKRLREEYGAGNGLTPAVLRTPDPKPEPVQNVSAEHIARLKEMQAVALEYFQGKLESPGGKPVADYLDGRKVSAAVRDHFQLGATDWTNGLTAKLQAAGYTDQELRDSGLVREREGEFYDRWHGRLMIPIHDKDGELVGFAGRRIPTYG